MIGMPDFSKQSAFTKGASITTWKAWGTLSVFW